MELSKFNELNSYLFKIDRDWKISEGSCLKDAVIRLADYYQTNFELFQIAISGCGDNDITCIEMYNHFASSYEEIEGVYKLGEYIYGEES